MIAQSGDPEVRDALRCGGDVFGQGGVIIVVLGGDSFASLDLLLGGLGSARDDGFSSLVERFGEVEILLVC